MKAHRIFPILLVIALIAGGGYYLMQTAAANGTFTVSGTMEATEYRLGSMQGGRVDRVDVDEGDRVEEGAIVAVVHPGASTRGSSGREMIHAPIAGLVLYRSVEPGEIVAAGAPLMTMIDPDDLTLTVYVPEDRYGQIKLGQSYPVTVDSFPGETFVGTVTHIAGKAEFTPRNVQTTDSRKNTVFAVKLTLPPTDGKLKPGMPADVRFVE
jgi:multidrug resistance efflux pump